MLYSISSRSSVHQIMYRKKNCENFSICEIRPLAVFIFRSRGESMSMLNRLAANIILIFQSTYYNLDSSILQPIRIQSFSALICQNLWMIPFPIRWITWSVVNRNWKIESTKFIHFRRIKFLRLCCSRKHFVQQLFLCYPEKWFDSIRWNMKNYDSIETFVMTFQMKMLRREVLCFVVLSYHFSIFRS